MFKCLMQSRRSSLSLCLNAYAGRSTESFEVFFKDFVFIVTYYYIFLVRIFLEHMENYRQIINRYYALGFVSCKMFKSRTLTAGLYDYIIHIFTLYLSLYLTYLILNISITDIYCSTFHNHSPLIQP